MMLSYVLDSAATRVYSTSMSNTNRYRATGLQAEIDRQGRRRDWIASEAGVHQSLIAHLTSGRRTASETVALAIASALGVDDIFLLFELTDGSETHPNGVAA